MKGKKMKNSKFVKKPTTNNYGMKGKPQNQGSEKSFARISHNNKLIKKK